MQQPEIRALVKLEPGLLLFDTMLRQCLLHGCQLEKTLNDIQAGNAEAVQWVQVGVRKLSGSLTTPLAFQGGDAEWSF